MIIMNGYNIKQILFIDKLLKERRTTLLTVSMDPHTAGTDVGGDCEVGEPEIFDVHVAECGSNCCVELAPGEHRRGRVSQVE